MLRETVDCPSDDRLSDLIEDRTVREEITDANVDPLLDEVAVLDEHLDLVLLVNTKRVDHGVRLILCTDEGVDGNRGISYLLDRLVVDFMWDCLELRDRVVVDDLSYHVLCNFACEVSYES